MAKNVLSKEAQLIGNTVFNTTNWMQVALDAIPENYHKSLPSGKIQLTKGMIADGLEKSVEFMKSNMKQLVYIKEHCEEIMRSARESMLGIMDVIEDNKDIPSNPTVMKLYDELNRIENLLCC